MKAVTKIDQAKRLTPMLFLKNTEYYLDLLVRVGMFMSDIIYEEVFNENIKRLIIKSSNPSLQHLINVGMFANKDITNELRLDSSI